MKMTANLAKHRLHTYVGKWAPNSKFLLRLITLKMRIFLSYIRQNIVNASTFDYVLVWILRASVKLVQLQVP